MHHTPRLFAFMFFLCLPSAGAAKPKEVSPKTGQAPANPQQDETLIKAKKLFAEGEDFFKLGQFDKAIEKYQEAYLLSKAPLFLLNIGQCYAHLNQPKEAKHSYEAFIREDPNSPYRAEAEEKMKEMQALIDKQEATSLPLAMQTPPQEPTKRKPLLWAGAGGVVLGGAALTILFLSNKTSNPASDLGGQFVDF